MRMDGELEGERDSVERERERERYLMPAETGCGKPSRSLYLCFDTGGSEAPL